MIIIHYDKSDRIASSCGRFYFYFSIKLVTTFGIAATAQKFFYGVFLPCAGWSNATGGACSVLYFASSSSRANSSIPAAGTPSA